MPAERSSRSDWLARNILIGFILNLPYTLIGLLVGLISGIKSIGWDKEHKAIIVNVRKFWWVAGHRKGVRAMVAGHTVLLGPNLEDKDLEHELIHVEQHDRAPIIHPILYYIELWRKGYRNNKYEIEAYRRAGNTYKEK